jgi:hypothetical protein
MRSVAARGHAVTLLTTLIASQCIGHVAVFASEPCRNNVIPAPGPHPYRRIGERCEGEFIREVGSSLEVLSVTAGEVPKLNPGKSSISLFWSSLPIKAFEINVRVLRPHTYYRMDITPKPDDLKVLWPLDELRKAGHENKHIAIRATAIFELKGVIHNIFVPIRVDTVAAGTAVPFYRIVFTSGDEVHSLEVTLRDKVRNTTYEVWKNETKARDVFPPTWPITLDIPASIRGKGIYLLEAIAHTRMSESLPLIMEFAHE